MHIIRKFIIAVRWFYGILFIISGIVGCQIVFSNSRLWPMILQPIGMVLFGISLLPIIWRILNPYIKRGKNVLPIVIPIICIIISSFGVPLV